MQTPGTSGILHFSECQWKKNTTFLRKFRHLKFQNPDHREVSLACLSKSNKKLLKNIFVWVSLVEQMCFHWMKYVHKTYECIITTNSFFPFSSPPSEAFWEIIYSFNTTGCFKYDCMKLFKVIITVHRIIFYITNCYSQTVVKRLWRTIMSIYIALYCCNWNAYSINRATKAYCVLFALSETIIILCTIVGFRCCIPMTMYFDITFCKSVEICLVPSWPIYKSLYIEMKLVTKYILCNHAYKIIVVLFNRTLTTL